MWGFWNMQEMCLLPILDKILATTWVSQSLKSGKLDVFKPHSYLTANQTDLCCWPQFYIQLVFKAPLCITLTISDQKIVSGSLFLTQKIIFPIFFKIYFIFLLSNFSVRTIQCKKKLTNYFFANENMKKTPQKVAYLSRNSVVSEIFLSLPNSPNGRIHVPKCGL